MADILPDGIFKCIFFYEIIPIQISLKFVLKSPVDDKPAVVKVIAWHRPDDKPLPESMMAQLTDAYMLHLGEMSLEFLIRISCLVIPMLLLSVTVEWKTRGFVKYNMISYKGLVCVFYGSPIACFRLIREYLRTWTLPCGARRQIETEQYLNPSINRHLLQHKISFETTS